MDYSGNLVKLLAEKQAVNFSENFARSPPNFQV